MQPIVAFGFAGGWEWIIILLIVVMLFGVGKLPQVAEQLGLGIKTFRKSLKEEDEEEAKPKELKKDEVEVEVTDPVR